MHITLFKALRTINLNDDQATQVVAELEEYIAVKIQDANKGLESKLDAQTATLGGQIASLDAQIASLDAQNSSLKWVIGSVGLLMAVVGLAPAFTKLFN